MKQVTRGRRDSSLHLLNALDVMAEVDVKATNSNFFSQQAIKRELAKKQAAVKLVDSVDNDYAQEFANNLVDDDLVAKARAMRQRRRSR